MDDRLDKIFTSLDHIRRVSDMITTILEQNLRIEDAQGKGKQPLNTTDTSKRAAELNLRDEEFHNGRYQKTLIQGNGGKLLSLLKAPKIDIRVFKGNEEISSIGSIKLNMYFPYMIPQLNIE